jgi:MFS transporter, CP family, cyanate transporter
MTNQDANAEPEHALTPAKDRATSAFLEQADRSTGRGKDTDTVLSAAPPDRLGVALAVAGIVLVGLNLRPAVVSLSPIYEAVARSFAVGNGARSVMGSLPVFCFAIFGALTPRLARRIGLAQSLTLAMALVCLGQLGRAYLSHSVVIFSLLSVVALAGIGVGNVLVPQAIRHYLPQRIPQMTGLYLACTIIGAALPALVAVPSANAIGWRNSLGVWGLFALIAVLPWLAMLHESVIPPHYWKTKLPMWRSTTAWAVTALFFVGACLTFTLIQWLPPLLRSTDDVSRAAAGVMLSLFTLVGLPFILIVPGILARTRRPYVVVAITALCAFVGPIGLAFAPHLVWIWVILAGIGATLLYGFGVTLVNLRTRTEEGAGQLSGFMQGIGYLIAGTGPILVGYLHAATGGWVAPCLFLGSLAVVAAAVGVIAVRPVSIEDEVAPAPSPQASAATAQTIQPPGPRSGSSTHGTREDIQQ